MINDIEELFGAAVLLEADEILENNCSSKPKKLIIKHWMNIPGKSFNTENGVLAFTDETDSLYVIPNFAGLIQLLKSNGFRQNYVMPVPLSDGFSPRIHKSYWTHLQFEFRQQYARC